MKNIIKQYQNIINYLIIINSKKNVYKVKTTSQIKDKLWWEWIIKKDMQPNKTLETFSWIQNTLMNIKDKIILIVLNMVNMHYNSQKGKYNK